MESIKNLLEYYDELYPVTEAQQKFFEEFISIYPRPTRFLNIGCGTGVMENRLAKDTTDVTGLETDRGLLESATRKHRTQLMAVRYFQMSTIEMSRFLGKGFYNVISCLNDRIIFIHDQVLLKKFFFDCRQLLAEDGTVVIGLTNYDLYNPEPRIILPEIKSIRVSLSGRITKDAEGNAWLDRRVETGNGRFLPVYEKTKVYVLHPDELTAFAKEAGFTSVEFYDGFTKRPADEKTVNLIAMIK